MADAVNTCSAHGCNRDVNCKELCKHHYDKSRRESHLGHARRMARRVKDKPNVKTAAEFLRDLGRSPSDDCIDWPYSVMSNGYGTVRFEGRVTTAHRAALIVWKGYPPSPEHQAAHEPLICHNRKCVNPRHLSWKTKSENEADKLLDGTVPKTVNSPSRNKSGHTGVHFHKASGKWRATIHVGRKPTSLGSFNCLAAAVVARGRAEFQNGF